jgi:antitoxin component YwqK of YwqJK toxin-antitoxin module
LKTRWSILFLLTLRLTTLFSQHAEDKHHARRYTRAQVLDSAEGVLIYQKMMKVLEMDYALIKEQGYEVKGWNEEYYENGQLQHISYYKENKLVLFKNFFDNGQCEHYVTYTDPMTCNIDVYYSSGSLKNHVEYYNGIPKKVMEFFESGLPKSAIDYDSEKNCLSAKKTWYVNAEMQSELVLLDVMEKKYSEKMYYPNGQLKEEGELIFSEATNDYLKINTWHTYESTGKKKHSEKYKVRLSSN